MWSQSLSKDCAIDAASAAAAAGQTTVTGSTLDMQDWDGILAIALLNGAVNGAVVSLQMQEGAASNGSDAVLPAGGANAGYTFGASPLTGLLISEVYRPRSRYVTPVLTRGTQNVAVGNIVVIRFRERLNPVTQGSTILAQALAVGA